MSRSSRFPQPTLWQRQRQLTPWWASTGDVINFRCIVGEYELYQRCVRSYVFTRLLCHVCNQGQNFQGIMSHTATRWQTNTTVNKCPWLLLLLLSRFSCVRLLATPWTAVGNTEKVNNDTVPFSTWSPQCLNGFRCDLGKSCSYAEWCRNPPCVLCTVAIRVTLALPRWDGCVLRAHLYLLLSRINLRRPYFQSCWSWPCWLKIWNWTSWTSSGTV